MSLLNVSIGTWRLSVGRTPPKPMDLTRQYDQTAWRWHSIISLLGYPLAYTRLFDELAACRKLTNIGKGARVLDAGIGTGALSMALTRALPSVPEINGVDISPRMLAQARRNLQDLRQPGLTARLRYGNVSNLPFADDEFDFVMSAHVLEHSYVPAATVTEMVRVLRPGAPLLIVTTRSNRLNAVHGLRWRYRSLHPPHLLHWLRQAGLKDIRRYPLGDGLSLPSLLSEAYLGRKIEGTR